jgi:hypothetical protein
VFTAPKALRLRLARDPAWTTWVGSLAVRAIGVWQRHLARKQGLRVPQTGAITFVQRFGGLVNLNVHFHLLVPDGVFIDNEDQLALLYQPRFAPPYYWAAFIAAGDWIPLAPDTLRPQASGP